MHRLILFSLVLLTACSQTPPTVVIPDVVSEMETSEIGGSWERDYSRDDDVNKSLQRAYNLLAQSIADQRRMDGTRTTGITPRQASSLVALARLAELITRSEVLQIVQTDDRVSIARRDDFALECRFFGGEMQPTSSPFGIEECGWVDGDLISRLRLREGLTVVSRFTVSETGDRLRVTTTVSSPTSRMPFTLRRFYRKFEEPESDYACIETLSMKRVCTTGEL